jgi:hypothetical protein
MFLWIVIGVIIWVVISSIKDKITSSSNRTGNTRPSAIPNNNRVNNTSSSNSTISPKTLPNKNAYRPRASTSSITKPKIVFNNSQKTLGHTNTELVDLSGLVDAFTGSSLNVQMGLYRCNNCSVFYHTESYNLLREVNNCRCVACSSTNIQLFTKIESDTTRGRNFAPDLVTLNNYKQHVGRVVTFEGYVPKVLVSRRGSDYAVMFENSSWSDGFKLVFFRGTIRASGGRDYIMGLKGKKIKVRGLIVKHDRFGYEIIVSEKSMIMDVK